MRQTKAFIALVVITAAAVAAAMWSQRPDTPVAAKGDLLFPGLIDKVNDVKTIAVRSADAALTIEAKGDGWVVAEKAAYPAQIDEVRALLVGAAELKRVEPKTTKAALFAKLELSDPGEGKESIGYTMKDANDTPIAKLIVGKRRLISSSVTSDQYYVRIPSENQAWLVEGLIPKHRVATDWLRSTIVQIDRERVHRTTVWHPDGTMVRTVKTAPGDASFTLMGLTAGQQIDSDYNVHALATTLADLSLNDVATADAIDTSKPDIRVRLETFDGLVIELTSGAKGEHVFFLLHAHVDESMPKLLGVEAGMTDEKADELRKKALAALKSPEDVKKEAGEYNAQWAGWAYRVPTYNLESMRRRIPDLVKAEKKTEMPNLLKGG